MLTSLTVLAMLTNSKHRTKSHGIQTTRFFFLTKQKKILLGVCPINSFLTSQLYIDVRKSQGRAKMF